MNPTHTNNSESQKSARFLVYGGGWRDNIGNAFIQIGCEEHLKQAFPNAHINIVDNQTEYDVLNSLEKLLKNGSNRLPKLIGRPFKKLITSRKRKVEKRSTRMYEVLDYDYLVLSGVWFAKEYMKEHFNVLSAAQEQGVRIIFLGVGGSKYTQEEIEKVQDALSKLDPSLVITRDQATYNNYKNILPEEKIYRGIDTAFFLNNLKDKYSLETDSTYDVYCFDKIQLSSNFKLGKKDIAAHHSVSGLKQDFTKHSQLMYSEVPQEYLSMYANCQSTYSDRVHACVASLAFGNSALLDFETPRAQLFDSVGISPERIRKNRQKLSLQTLEEKKKKQVNLLQEKILR